MQHEQHITRHKVITMQYTLTTARGVVIRAASACAVKHLHGAGFVFPKPEQALEQHVVGEIVKI